MAFLARFAAGIVLGVALAAGAQPRFAGEYEIKAAILFNLSQFIEWPSNAFTTAESPLVIGVLGQNPFGKSLNRLVEGEVVQKRRIVVRYGETLDELDSVHLLFISRSEARRLPAILRSLRGRSVLTVSDIDGFAETGGMINLVATGDRVRMLVNVTRLEGAGLRASSKLLRIAELVKAD